MMNPNAGPQWATPNQGGGNATMSNPSQQEAEFFAPLSTLDEPVRETIMRDVRAVASKLKVVMLPIDRSVSTMHGTRELGSRTHKRLTHCLSLCCCIWNGFILRIVALWRICGSFTDGECRTYRPGQGNYSGIEGLGSLGTFDRLFGTGSSIIA